MKRKRMLKACLWLLLAVFLLVMTATAFAWIQAQQKPAGRPEYVALGSSFAAGAGLGTLQDDSPLLCARSINGYPQQLAKILDMQIVDMSCGGAETKHLLYGGQFFQGPQIRVIDKRTQLASITVGGNDLGYIGDLSMLAARNSNSTFGWAVKHFWGGPKKEKERDYAKLRNQLTSLIRAIHKRAPDAVVVIATYPTILPPSGTCARLGLSAKETQMMRAVAKRLADNTRAVAHSEGALLVDMDALGTAHNACSAEPWTYGWTNAGKAPFHPTLRGARATAEAIARAVSDSRARN